jgi:putative endonuclease
VKRGPGLRAQESGSLGEETASRFLERLGYAILGRNFKTRLGEIDLIARDGAVTVFVEVKRRVTGNHGRATDFVGGAKSRRIVAAARLYAARHGLTESPMRFDVVAIDVVDGHELIQHHKGAFDAR